MPKFIITVRTPPVSWSRQKIRGMERDFKRFFAQNGAPNAEFIVTEEGGALAAPEPPQYLHLGCSACNTDWYAMQFNACGGCGGRETVYKVEPGRVPMPTEPEPGAEVEATTDAPELCEAVDCENPPTGKVSMVLDNSAPEDTTVGDGPRVAAFLCEEHEKLMGIKSMGPAPSQSVSPDAATADEAPAPRKTPEVNLDDEDLALGALAVERVAGHETGDE